MRRHFADCRIENCRCESKRYWIILWIGLGIFIAEIIGGIISGSLALLSDAFHVLTDSVAYFVSIVVAYLVAKRGRDERKLRAVGGYINATLLLIIAGWVMYEAAGRLFSPPKITSGLMIAVAVFGALGNLLQNYILEHATAAEEAQVTHQSAHLHVLSDLWQSIAVIAAGIIIAVTGWRLADSILSIVISLAMIYWSARLFRQSRREAKSDNADNSR